MFHLSEVWGERLNRCNPCRLIERDNENHRERFVSTAEASSLAETMTELERARQERDGVMTVVRLLLVDPLLICPNKIGIILPTIQKNAYV